MACGGAALAPLLSPQPVVKRSAARRTEDVAKNDVIAENLGIIVRLKGISQPTDNVIAEPKLDSASEAALRTHRQSPHGTG
jgi:hypothetical protein